MEPLCQIKQLLLTRRGGEWQSWKPFSLTAKTRLTGNAACYSRSHSNIVVPPEPGGGGQGAARAWWLSKLTVRRITRTRAKPAHSFFFPPLEIACELNIRKCAWLPSTAVPSTEAVNHICASRQCPFVLAVRLCPLESRTTLSPGELHREIRLRR